ncbi:MAG TPA: hypothetical protein GX707_10200 [Epulopiscium sp.]|nr:hypothetical protein [Candidatus Epulonipiscium sp.]
MNSLNRIELNSLKVINNKVCYNYSVSGEWTKYFNLQTEFFVQYNENISNVPTSILAIPFISNILPIAWLCDANIYVKELDSDFFYSIHEFKKGYINMYPMLTFGGSIEVAEVINHKKSNLKRKAVFFSGGVDAFSTLITHIEKKPLLVTLWGADIDLSDVDGWNKNWANIKRNAADLDLECAFIKTSFRKFINMKWLGRKVKKTKGGWWYGFQHGIGIISHIAPIAYLKGIDLSYIASSFTRGDKVTCASDPSIDNHIQFCGSKVFHDGYDFDRQDKINVISKFIKKNKRNLHLHVCWKSSGGENCCRCEKCFRTITGLLLAKQNPSDLGFIHWQKYNSSNINFIKRRLTMSNHTIKFWVRFPEIFRRNKENHPFFQYIEWLDDMDFNKINQPLIKRLFLLNDLARKIITRANKIS